MTAGNKNRSVKTSAGRVWWWTGLKISVTFKPVVLFITLILFHGLGYCVGEEEKGHTSPLSESQISSSKSHTHAHVERAKSILGVVDHPEGESFSSSHQTAEDTRKIIMSMKKEFLAKNLVPATSISAESQFVKLTNKDVIKNKMNAVSSPSLQGDQIEVGEIELKQQKQKNVPPGIVESKHVSAAAGQAAGEESKGRKKFIQLISEVVLRSEHLGKQEGPNNPQSEETSHLDNKINRRDREEPVEEVLLERDKVELNPESMPRNSLLQSDVGKSEAVTYTEETSSDTSEGAEVEEGTPHDEAGGDREHLRPVSSSLEVAQEAFNMQERELTQEVLSMQERELADMGNFTINPVGVVDNKHKILTRKSDVTLRHFIDARKFLSSFPHDNITHLNMYGSIIGVSKQMQDDIATTEEVQSQSRTVPTFQEEKTSVEGENQQEVANILDASDDVIQSSKLSEHKEKPDTEEKKSQEIKENETKEDPSHAKAKEDLPASLEEKHEEQTEGDDRPNGKQPQKEDTVRTDQHTASRDADKLDKELAQPTEAIQPVDNGNDKETFPKPVSSEPEDLQDSTEAKNTTTDQTEIKVVSETMIVTKLGNNTEELSEDMVGKSNLTTKEDETSAITQADSDKDKHPPDSSSEISEIKKKERDSGKSKKKDASDISVDTDKELTRKDESDTLETYSQFTQRVNAEKKNDIISNGHGSNGHSKGPKVKSKNYASPDCGSKLLTANPEASHASKVIHANKDEYLLNKCRDKTWFIIELCESIRPQKFDIANFELFSNLPKDIHVSGSHRYPSREWTSLARVKGEEGNRGVQSYPVETDDFFKYIKVEVPSHYGSEFFCPISLFRIYGLSEFEVIDTIEDQTEDHEESEEPFIDPQLDEKKYKEEGKPSVIPAVIKNMFSGVLDVIKRGYRPHTGSTEPGESCYSLHPKYAVDKRSCQLAESLNYILSCYQREYEVLMQKSFMSLTVKNSGFCRLLASAMCLDPHVNDSVVYDTICNNSYVCIMLSPKHVLAMCFMHESHIMDSEVACESSSPLLPENFSTTPSNILPSENDMPSYVKNAKINTSSITRTDATVSDISGTSAPQGSKHDQDADGRQAQVDQVSLEPKEPLSPPAVETSTTETSKPAKKPKTTSSGQQDKVVKDGDQHINVTETEESVEVEGSSFGGLELEEEENPREEGLLPATPQPLEPKISSTSPTNKESVVVRLSNKIKALEYNMSISSQYLEELSRRYKRQMEEMQHQFNLTIAALNATSRQAFERDQHHQRDIETLEEQLASVTAILEKLVADRESLAHTVVEQHLLLMVVEVVVLCVVFILCNKRTPHDRLQEAQEQDRRAKTPSDDPSDVKVQDAGGGGSGEPVRGRLRRRSVDSITQERSSRRRRCRRPSEEALRISGTYEDLLIIEPAIPIMMDSVSDRKRKKKSSSGTLKRSKSNASLVEKSCNSTRRSRCIEDLDTSSAGVLFCGDQVEAKGPSSPSSPSPSPSSLLPYLDSPYQPQLPNEPLMNSRSFITEIDPENNDTKTVITKRHSIASCQSHDSLHKKGMKLSKSHSLNSASEKVKNRGDKSKKIKKGKKNKNNVAEIQHGLIYEANHYHETNRTSYNGQDEHSPEYYYNGRSIVHFSEETADHSEPFFSADVPDTGSYINGDSSQVVDYVGSEYMHSSYAINITDKRKTSKGKLRSDNWEWYSLQHNGSSSETVSTCSDSSGKNRIAKHDILLAAEISEDRKLKRKKKSKTRSPVVLEEEPSADLNTGT